MRKHSIRKFSEIVNRVPEDYYHKGVENNLFQKIWHQRKWNMLDEMLNGAKGKLLDVGCADGTTTRYIKKSHPKLKVTGVDLYLKAINFAKKVSSDITFVQADAHKLPFADKSYNWVVTVEVLEHLHDSDKVLGEINRLLKKNGYLIVGQDTDNLLFKIIWWFWTKSKGSVWTQSHINCMSPNKLLQAIRNKGFKIKKIKFINFGMEVFILAQKK